jgi:predicted nucleic acid-binding protein
MTVDFLFWDASALIKRYTPEAGSDMTDVLFLSVPPSSNRTTLWTYSETYAILCRKLNDRRIDLYQFRVAVRRLEEDFLGDPGEVFLAVEDASLFSGLTLIRRHNLNTVDATILSVLLNVVSGQSYQDRLFLVTADQRLVRAARAEGLPTLNPEVTTEEDVAALLGGP